MTAPESPAPDRLAEPVDPVDVVFPGTENLDAAAVFAQPGYTAPPIVTEPSAIAALVFAMIFFIPAVPVIGVILGIVALNRCARLRRNGRGMATSAIVIGAILSAIHLMIALLWSTAG
ncbi:MAG: DUF4190 domain-containing protein [Bowdeniella nasicola]|nr:DUF4190 domain-containing protein [Bowdeniella nasicola]